MFVKESTVVYTPCSDDLKNVCKLTRIRRAFLRNKIRNNRKCFKLSIKILVKFTLKLLHYKILLFFHLLSKLKAGVFIEDMEDWVHKKINKHAHCTMVHMHSLITSEQRH